MALSLDDARRRTRLHARSLIDAVERDRPLWVRRGRSELWKIRACPLHVRFIPLSGRMLRRVPTSPLGQKRSS